MHSMYSVPTSGVTTTEGRVVIVLLCHYSLVNSPVVLSDRSGEGILTDTWLLGGKDSRGKTRRADT